MKKRLFFALSVLLAAVLGQGCNKPKEIVIMDYAGFSYYMWVNGSDHEITLSLMSAPLYQGDPGRPVFNETLPPGGSFEWEQEGNIAFCPPPSRFVGFIRTFTVTFDGQTEVAYEHKGSGVSTPTDYDQRYDLRWDKNYVHELVENPRDCKECPGARYTYTFTNADYEAAVAYSAGAEE